MREAYDSNKSAVPTSDRSTSPSSQGSSLVSTSCQEEQVTQTAVAYKCNNFPRYLVVVTIFSVTMTEFALKVAELLSKILEHDISAFLLYLTDKVKLFVNICLLLFSFPAVLKCLHCAVLHICHSVYFLIK